MLLNCRELRGKGERFCILKFGALICFLALLAGCGGVGVVTKPALSKQPEWLSQTPASAYMLYGVGSAEIYAGDTAGALARAKDVARVELVKQIEVDIEGVIEQEINETYDGENMELREEVRQYVKSQVPKFTFSFSEEADTYVDQVNKRVSSLIRLDVQRELAALNGQIQSFDVELEKLKTEESGTDKTGIDYLKLISPVFVMAEQRADLQARYNKLDPERPNHPLLSPQGRDLLKVVYDRIAEIRLYVNGKGNGSGYLKTALISHLNGKGMRTGDRSDADIFIQYNVDINSVVRDGSVFAFTKGQVLIKDRDGNIVKTVKASTKGVSSDSDEAISRAVTKLSRSLGKSIIQVLF